jgi:hypothetical protein
MKIELSVCSLFLLSACGSTSAPSEFQTLPLESGSYAIPFVGEIVGIDPIGLSSREARYSVSIGNIAFEILRGDRTEDTLAMDTAIKEFGTGVISEVEEYARSSNCLFTIRTDNTGVVSSIGSEVMPVFSDNQPEIDQEFLESDEFQAMSDREKFIAVNGIDPDQTGSEYGTDFVVLSQCLIWAQVGDSLRLAKFGGVVGIVGHVPVQSPPSEADNPS